MAEEKTNAQPEERDFSKMSVQELHNLVVTEGRNFVEQTKDGDIAIKDYINAENFSLTRLTNLFFAFEYFEKTEHGQSNKTYGDEYGELYLAVYDRLNKIMGGGDIYQGYIFQ